MATGVALAVGTATLPITGTAIVGIALFGATSGVIGGYYGSETAKDIYDAINAWYNEGSGKTKGTIVDRDNNGTTVSTVDSLTNALPELLFLTQSSNQNWDIRATIPSVTNPESYAEQLKYDSISKTATVKTPNSTTLNEGTTLLLKKDINQITINNHTADVATPTNLQLRNALTSIDDHQFLLSNILIKVGEKLDMGAAGVITVSSGDTLSQLAVQHLGGNAVDATREAVLLNPWLADYGRIKFSDDINKVLIKDGAVLNDYNNNHTINGENADDFIKDANGGDDEIYGGSGNDTINGGNDNDFLYGETGDDYLDGGADNDTLYGGDGDDVLLGSGGADYLNGGSGFDYYISDSGDVVEDSDGNGAVFFNNSDISGVKRNIANININFQSKEVA